MRIGVIVEHARELVDRHYDRGSGLLDHSFRKLGPLEGPLRPEESCRVLAWLSRRAIAKGDQNARAYTFSRFERVSKMYEGCAEVVLLGRWPQLTRRRKKIATAASIVCIIFACVIPSLSFGKIWKTDRRRLSGEERRRWDKVAA